MNFINAFSELDKLYESVDLNQLQEDVDEEVVEEAEEAATEEPVEETEEEVINKQIVLECIKCGALVIKDESEVTIDEESDLTNVGEECAYCEESEGFKAIGTFEPYVTETVDELEEGIFSKKEKEPRTIRGYVDKDPSFSKKVAKELQSKFGGEVKSVKLSGGEVADIWIDTNNKAKVAEKYISKQYPDNAFSFDEYYLVNKDAELEELFDANVSLDARGFGGSGNDVSVLSGGLGESIDEDELEEGIFDRKKKKDANSKKSGATKESKVTYTIYDENGTKQFSHTFTEIPGKMSAEEQLGNLLKDSHPRIYKECKNNRDWMYERTSVPASPLDTKRNRNYFTSELYLENLQVGEDEELEELFNANVDIDARGFGGSDNIVGVL